MYQPGGVSSITLHFSVDKAVKFEEDQLLGRWCCTTFRGKNNILTSIVTGYRPCRADGEHSTYQQHQRVYNVLQREGCPRQIWLDDMALYIKSKMADGQQVILMADINEDVT